MIGNTQIFAKFLALHVIVKKDLYMLTDKANRHKNIMLRMRFLLAHVVQHIRLDPRELRANPLRMGLSMTVKVDISESGTGKGMASTAEKGTVLPETDKVDWAVADALIEKIFEKYSK